jgi:hypothetical protein
VAASSYLLSDSFSPVARAFGRRKILFFLILHDRRMPQLGDKLQLELMHFWEKKMQRQEREKNVTD